MSTSKEHPYPRHQSVLAAVVGSLPSGELAHDIHHIQRVYAWALRLAPEASADRDLCGAAALVHDLVPIPKDSPDRALGGERSARAAGPVLAAAGYSAAEQAAVLSAVRTSSWSRGLVPESRIGVVLQDADRLDALGAVGIARCFACAQDMSRPAAPGRFYHPTDPLGLAERPLDDRRQAVDHFRAKLLKLAAGMHLGSAQEEAERRHQTLLNYLEALESEVASADTSLPGLL